MKKIALIFSVFFLVALIYPADAPAPIVHPCCGDGIVNQPWEECDGTDDTACHGECLSDCTCPCDPHPICGDDMVNQPSEECDGTDDTACHGECLSDCTCPCQPTPKCGDDMVNQPWEECDGTDDTACHGECLYDCTCPCDPHPICGDDMVNQPSEECDGTDDKACPGECLSDCTCPCDPPGICAPMTQGFWKRICDGVYGGKSRHPETPDNFSSEMLCKDFDGSPRSDPCVKADSQVAALRLNIIYGYLDKNCDIEYDGDDTIATVQDALDTIPTLNCKDAADLAEAINSRDAL